MAREAWGRWGAADEAGAPNRIGREQVRLAASLVRTGQVVSLAQPLSPASPVPKHRAGMQHFMGRDGGDYAAGAKRPGGFQFAEDTVVLPLHLGTHMDALCHAWCDDHLYNGFLGSTVRSTTRALRCGAEKLPPSPRAACCWTWWRCAAGRCRAMPASAARRCRPPARASAPRRARGTRC